MIRSNKPVSEGPVKVDSKSENTIIIRSAEEGEVTNLEAIDSTHTYVITDRVYVIFIFIRTTRFKHLFPFMIK